MKGGGVMEVFPLLRDGAAAGEVTAEREGLYRRFSLRADLPEGVWCVWLVGERGELSLGVPEPDEGAYRLCRRLSARSVEGLGQLLRGEVRPRRQQPEGWNGAPQPACLFRSGWLQRCSGPAGGETNPSGAALLRGTALSAGFPLLFCSYLQNLWAGIRGLCL